MWGRVLQPAPRGCRLWTRRPARLAADPLGIRAIATGRPAPAGHHAVTINIPLPHHVIRRRWADDAVVMRDVVPVPPERFGLAAAGTGRQRDEEEETEGCQTSFHTASVPAIWYYGLGIEASVNVAS